MDRGLRVDLPQPKYAVGTTVMALIDHKPRYARVDTAHLNAHIVLDAEGIFIYGRPRWEYEVTLYNADFQATTSMLIAERTILADVETDPDSD